MHRANRGFTRPAAWALAFLMATSSSSAALDAATAADGLREALQKGAVHAADLLGQVGGYFDNAEVRIPLPDSMEKVGNQLRKLGMDDTVDEFELSMNRAAEAAAPLAKDVFRAVVTDMSFSDALKIVRGEDNSATRYLKRNSQDQLTELFLPIVARQLEAVGATRSFDVLMKRITALPFVDEPVVELDSYVTDKALDGMFRLIAQEEKRIREDPMARTSDLLKTVFGSPDDEDERPWWKRLLD